MKYIRILMGVTLILGLQGSAQAQDFGDMILKLRNKYENAEKLHVVMDILVFENSQATVPYFRERADVKKDGVKYRYQFGSNDLLMNQKFLIVVDKMSKEIVVSERDVKGEKLLSDPFKMNMDSLLNIVGEPQFIGSKDGVDHYRLSRKDNQIERIDLFVNRLKGFIQRIEYRYSDEQVAYITTNVFDAAPVFALNTFNEQYYVVSSKGKYIPAADFSGYTVVTGDD